MSKLLELFSPLFVVRRSAGTFRKYKHAGAIIYPGGIRYYPRFENEVDPDITPSKLFLVERIKPIRGTPYWQKHVLRIMHLDIDEQRISIVKNIPEMNALLWQVKHLIRVSPITYPYGEPTEADIEHTRLKLNGECLVTKEIRPDQRSIDAFDAFDKDKKKMDTVTLRKDSRLKWMQAWGGGY